MTEVIDIVAETNQLKAYEISCIFSPIQWLTFATPVPLQWHNVKFHEANRAAIPKSEGVYAFAIQPDVPGLAPSIYVAYIGSTTRTLRVRYGEYLREVEFQKRPNVAYLLRQWKDHLRFYYSAVQAPSKDILEIERSLNDALQPRYSHRDFHATVRKARSAL